MFGGILDNIGRIVDASPPPGGHTLVVAASNYWTDVASGASVAIDGVCLTLTRASGDRAEFDVIAETLRRSTLGDLQAGSRVNLQESLRVGDRVDGHFVQGHVDAIATISRVEQSAAEAMWWFAPPKEALACIIPKGGIAIDGISLTIAIVRGDEFSVALIPTTLERTTLGSKRAGNRVNIETDILARTVVSYLRSMQKT